MSVVDDAWNTYINKTEAALTKTQRKNAKKRAKGKGKIAAGAEEHQRGSGCTQHVAIDCCAAQRNNEALSHKQAQVLSHKQDTHPTAQRQDANYRLLSPTMESERAAIELYEAAQRQGNNTSEQGCTHTAGDRNTGMHTDALEHQVRTPAPADTTQGPAEQHDGSRGRVVYDQLWAQAHAKALEDPDRSAETLHTSTVAIFRHLKKKYKSTQKKWHKRHS